MRDARPRSHASAQDPAERFRSAWSEAGEALIGLLRAEGATDSDRPMLVSVTEAARLLGVKRSTVYGLLDTNRLPGYRIGRRRLISTAAIRELVTSLAGNQLEVIDAVGESTKKAARRAAG